MGVKDYKKAKTFNKMQVMTNSSLFCMQTDRKIKDECIDDGTGHNIGEGDFMKPQTWVTVDVAASSSQTSVIIDLTNSSGVAFAVRYAWHGTCCVESNEKHGGIIPCPLESCPIFAEDAKLPANPFIAKIVNGKCKCIAPQVCDESSEDIFYA